MLVSTLPWPGSRVFARDRAQGIAFRVSETRTRMHDDVLVDRVTLGDHEAFAALYDRHSALVYGIARRIVGEGAQAEDVTQSVFLQVWTRPQSYRGGNFSAWIARVARNACLDIVRSSAVRMREPEFPDDVVAETRTEEEAFASLRAEAVVAALQELPGDQRDAIEKAYFEGLSYREVAEQMGAPLGTVKSRIRVGLRRLWESLRQRVPS